MTALKNASISYAMNPERFVNEGVIPNRFRLQHLPPEKANQPKGRGSESAAGRGYDTELLVKMLYNGTTQNRASWYDVRAGSDPEYRYETKCCIRKHPCGNPGTFTLWRPHHRKLLNCKDDIPGAVGRYFFLIYTVLEEDFSMGGMAIELGKFEVRPAVIDDLIDEWFLRKHDTMGLKYARDVTWTRLVSELEIDIDELRETEVVTLEDDNQWHRRDLYSAFEPYRN